MSFKSDELKGYARRAEIYRTEYNEERDIPFYLSFITEGQTEVLEIPSGAGRLTCALAKKAKHVTAIDIEPRMIASLREHVEANGLGKKVSAYVGDMTDFEARGMVDLIIVPSEAIQLLPPVDGNRALVCMVEALRPGGNIVLDLATFAEHSAGDPDYFDPASIGDRWQEQWKRDLPNGGTLRRHVRVERRPGSRRFEFRYILERQNAEPELFSERMDLYLYRPEWFLQNVPSGIATVSIKASYDKTRSLVGSSRFIVVMQKFSPEGNNVGS